MQEIPHSEDTSGRRGFSFGDDPRGALGFMLDDANRKRIEAVEKAPEILQKISSGEGTAKLLQQTTGWSPDDAIEKINDLITTIHDVKDYITTYRNALGLSETEFASISEHANDGRENLQEVLSQCNEALSQYNQTLSEYGQTSSQYDQNLSHFNAADRQRDLAHGQYREALSDHHDQGTSYDPALSRYNQAEGQYASASARLAEDLSRLGEISTQIPSIDIEYGTCTAAINFLSEADQKIRGLH